MRCAHGLHLLQAMFLAGLLGCATSADSDPSLVPWSGAWESSFAREVQGTIACSLPSPFPLGVTLQVLVTITYATTSPYRPGQSIQAEFAAEFSDRPIHGVGQPQNESWPVSLTLKGAPRAGQRIAFTAAVATSESRLTGRYESRGPVDAGTFWIQQQ
jgi:hypothetical protein